MSKLLFAIVSFMLLVFGCNRVEKKQLHQKVNYHKEIDSSCFCFSFFEHFGDNDSVEKEYCKRLYKLKKDSTQCFYFYDDNCNNDTFIKKKNFIRTNEKFYTINKTIYCKPGFKISWNDFQGIKDSLNNDEKIFLDSFGMYGHSMVKCSSLELIRDDKSNQFIYSVNCIFFCNKSVLLKKNDLQLRFEQNRLDESILMSLYLEEALYQAKKCSVVFNDETLKTIYDNTWTFFYGNLFPQLDYTNGNEPNSEKQIKLTEEKIKQLYKRFGYSF